MRRRASVTSDSATHSFKLQATLGKDRKGREVLILDRVEIGGRETRTIMVVLTHYKARRFAQWILDNTAEAPK